MRPYARTLGAVLLFAALGIVSALSQPIPKSSPWDRSDFVNGQWTCCRICPDLFYHVKPVMWSSLLETGKTPRTPSAFIQVAAKLHSRQIQGGVMTKFGRCCKVCKQEYTKNIRYPKMLTYTNGIEKSPPQPGTNTRFGCRCPRCRFGLRLTLRADSLL